ncbi:hypothetical protein BC332_21814 [Capsicum chinense]|nr:hypothetical protein BC332_21814 [Capsicum chinense]
MATLDPGDLFGLSSCITTTRLMLDEFKVMLDLNPIWHASDFGSISVVKTSSPGADGSLVSAYGAKSSPIVLSPAANLPTIVASESSSLYGKVSSLMIETVEMKNSSEPTSPAVANSEKIGIAVTLEILSRHRSETTTTQDAVVYGDGFSSENREKNVKKDAAITEIGGATPSDEKTVKLGPLVYGSKAEAKSAFKTLLESANIGSDCTWDQAMRAVINDRRYGALKSLCERKQAFNESYRIARSCHHRLDRGLSFTCNVKLSAACFAISIFEHDERFKAVERAKDREDLFEDYVEELEKKVKLLLQNFLEYIRDLESEEEEQRKLWMEELRKAERKKRVEFRKLMEKHVAIGILNAKTNWRNYCIKIKDFAAYLAVASNTSGLTTKDLFTDVMDELEKQIAGIVATVMILAIGSGGGGCDVKLVNWMVVVEVVTLVTVVVMVSEECVEVDDVLVVVSDVCKLMMCWWSLVVVLVLIDELVGSKDRPVVVDGGSVGGRGVHGLIWYLDDKSQIQDAVRMAEIGLTSAWTLDDFKVAIAKYISSPPMSDTNLKVQVLNSRIDSDSLGTLFYILCYGESSCSEDVMSDFVFEELLERARKKEEKKAKKLKRLADEFYELLHASKEILHHRNGRTANPSSEIGKIMGGEGLLLEIFNKFVNELKEKECMRQEDKHCVLRANRYIIMMISSTPALCLTHQQILNDDDILDGSVVSCVSIDILSADDILDAGVVSSASTAIE